MRTISMVLLVAVVGTAEAEPLKVHPTNPRYFTDGTTNQDGSVKAVYLTGSHTWANLIDRGPSDPPPVFDFTGYLDLLEKHHHNFIRLWSRQVTWYHDYGEGELHAGPLAWARTGPGMALDGKLKFDLSKLSDSYFERLRSRVVAAGKRGIYVGVMLFGGNYECKGGWRGNPFNKTNNINSVNGDPNGDNEGFESHTIEIAAIVRMQESYVRRVIDTVNDLDNVLYEISNEGHSSSLEWQRHFLKFIRDYERTKPKQHPVGMTALYMDDAGENNRALNSSAADWISPMTDARKVRDIPAANGSKVAILDSDHWFVTELYKDAAFGREWVWKAFCRGYNPILMEHFPPRSFIQNDHPVSLDDPGYVASRRAMGHTRRFAERVKLAKMSPRDDLASSRFCLANPGVEYVIYKPADSNVVSVDLPPRRYMFEWFDAIKGATASTGSVEASTGRTRFEAPFHTEGALYLNAMRP